MNSEAPNTVKNEIIVYLLMHPSSNIDSIQFMLKKRFPKTYKKNSNLTMIHRHLRDMKVLGIVEFETKHETVYSISPEFKKQCLWIIEKSIKEKNTLPDLFFDFTSPMARDWIRIKATS